MVRGIAQQPFNPLPYTNPYWQSVADVTAQQALRNNDIARNARSANAVSAGAFGGYRQGIEESEANNNLQTQLNNIYFQAGNNAYDRGVSSFFQDQNRGLQNASALSAQGTQQQQLGQQNLDTMYNDFLTQRDWPKTQLQFVADQFRGNPATQLNYGSTTSGTSNQPPGSMVGQLGSLGLGAYGLFRMLGNGRAKGGPIRGISHYARGGAVRRYDQGGGVGSLTPDEIYAILQREAEARRRSAQAPTTPPAGLPRIVGPLNPIGTPSTALEDAMRFNRERATAPPTPRGFTPHPYSPTDRPEGDFGSGGVGTASVMPGGYPPVPERQPGLALRSEDALPNPFDPPRPATALPGRRGIGQIPRSTQEASALPADTREAAFLRAQDADPQQSSTAPQTTQTIQDAMRDNIDRGESILMMAAKWAEAAGRPGATAIGSLGEGAVSGLTNLRDQRREQRDTQRFEQQLGLTREQRAEDRRWHDIESADRREQIAAGERNARMQANATMSTAGAAESIRNRYNDETARMLASDDPQQQRMGQARLDATTQGYSAALRARTQEDIANRRSETADENRIGALARTMVQSGMPLAEVIAEIERTQPGAGAVARRALLGGPNAPTTAVPTFDPQTRRLIMPGQ